MRRLPVPAARATTPFAPRPAGLDGTGRSWVLHADRAAVVSSPIAKLLVDDLDAREKLRLAPERDEQDVSPSALHHRADERTGRIHGWPRGLELEEQPGRLRGAGLRKPQPAREEADASPHRIGGVDARLALREVLVAKFADE